MNIWNMMMESASQWGTGTILLRSVLSLLMGSMIGIDRSIKRRGAGMKTHALVCMGAALTMMTGEYMYVHFQLVESVPRLGAQVISGIGFLGVGTIIVTGKNQVRGLTTAAGLWACACVGLAIGVGFLEGALVICLLIFITLKVLPKIEEWLDRHSKIYDVYIEFESAKCVGSFLTYMRSENLKISIIDISKSKFRGGGVNGVFNIVTEERLEPYDLFTLIKSKTDIKHIEML